ncbi:hypothetical protein C1645_815646 [Glomus cerebriforme]|uniref:Uncharacterized protein n=1 Tax=Glomus cerebriforme TaxID=658196 RepID=A0A397TD86_9GLOM|nr:hypothetical protein C1645_815646 [Glomus cerebriforme]
MKNIISNTNINFSYTSDLLFISYYDFSYNNSDLFTIYQYNCSDLPIFEFYDSSYDFSDLFLDYNIYKDEDGNVDHQEKEYNNSNYEKEKEEKDKEEENELELN